MEEVEWRRFIRFNGTPVYYDGSTDWYEELELGVLGSIWWLIGPTTEDGCSIDSGR